METLELFKRKLEYNHWANLRAAEAVSTTNPVSAKGHSALIDILLTEKLWLARLRGEDTGKVPSDIFRKVPEVGFVGLIDESFRAYDTYLRSVDEADLDVVSEFTQFFNEPCKMTRREMLVHIFNQTAGHRGQISMIVDNEGGEPVLSSYNAFAVELTSLDTHETEQ